MIKDIEPISKVRPVKLKLHKHLTLRGLYYRKLISKIQNPKTKKIISKNINTKSNSKEANMPSCNPIIEEGSLLDKYC